MGAVVPLLLSAVLFFGKGERAGGRVLALGIAALVCLLVGGVCFRLCLGAIGI